MTFWARVGRDLKAGDNVDVYVAVGIAIVASAGSLLNMFSAAVVAVLVPPLIAAVAIAALQNRHRLEMLQDVIKTTIGVTELPLRPSVLTAIERALPDTRVTRSVHPEGSPVLRRAICEYYREQWQCDVSSDRVFVNAGSSALVRNIVQLLCGNGEAILLPRPYYCLYLMSGILAKASIAFYDVDERSGQIDMDSFGRAFDPTRTRLVVVNSPGNPLGNVLSAATLSDVNRFVAGRAYILHDEIYANVCFYDEYKCPLSYLTDHRSRHIITGGFSKAFRMYTKRLGFAIVPDEMIGAMRIVQQHTLLTPDPVSQIGAAAALDDLDGVRELRDRYRQKAEYAVERLSGRGCRPIPPRGGFYITLDCREWIARNGGDSASLAYRLLEEARVAAVPGSDFGLENTLRLAFCSERFEEAIDRLGTYFA